jgi:hypothetical protein
MSNPVQAVNAVNPHEAQTQTPAAPAKPAAAPTAAPQDKVTISESAKQALSSSTQPAGSR